VGLGFGLLSAQLRSDDSDWRRAYQDTIDTAARAEALGFDSVWTTEHHFIDDGYMPSLLAVSAAIAAATSRIEIATGVLLAPLHHPLRLAEDAATVQLLSDGRLTLGLGLGWSATEYEAFSADMRTRGRAMDEILTILRNAWSGGVFEHDGDVYQFPPLAVRPTPHRPIPIVIGGGAEAAIRRAGTSADGIFSNVPSDRYLTQVGWARQEIERRGGSVDDFRWLHYTVMYPCDDTQAGWERLRPHLWQMSWKYSDMEASATRTGALPEAPPLAADQEARIRERAVLVGTSDEIVSRLMEIRERSGVDTRFVARSSFHTMDPAEQDELMERLATEVAPHLP
jgi:probable F420-dependent oxidoreductase